MRAPFSAAVLLACASFATLATPAMHAQAPGLDKEPPPPPAAAASSPTSSPAPAPTQPSSASSSPTLAQPDAAPDGAARPTLAHPPAASSAATQPPGTQPSSAASSEPATPITPPDAPARPSGRPTLSKRESDAEAAAPVPFDPVKAQKNIEIANYYIRTGNYNAAIDRLQEATTEQPGVAEPFKLLGKAYEKKRDLKDAVDAYRRYLVVYAAAPDRDAIRKEIDRLTAEMGK